MARIGSIRYLLMLVVAAFLTSAHAQPPADFYVDVSAGPQSVRVPIGVPVSVGLTYWGMTFCPDTPYHVLAFQGQVPPGMSISTYIESGVYIDCVATLKQSYLVGQPSTPGAYKLTASYDGSSIPIEIVVTEAQIDSLEITQGIQQNRPPSELTKWLGGGNFNVVSGNLEYELLEGGQVTLPKPLKIGDLPAPLVESKPGFLRVYLKEVQKPTVAKVRIWVLPAAPASPPVEDDLTVTCNPDAPPVNSDCISKVVAPRAIQWISIGTARTSRLAPTTSGWVFKT